MGQKKLPGVGFKKLKKILKRCSRDMDSHARFHDKNNNSSSPPPCSPTCPNQCPVCDGTFFPSLVNEMSAVVWCFNERAQKLLDWHLASSFNKCFIWFKGRVHGNHGALIQEGKDLVHTL